MNKLTLNFLKLSTSDFSITCFRRQCLIENEPSPGDDFHRVNFSERTPDGVKVDHWFWISIEQREGFEPFSFIASQYVHASLWILRRTFFVSFAEHIKSFGILVETESGLFKKLLIKVVKCYDENDQNTVSGYQGFRCSMEWLPSAHAFGMFVNFHFFCNDDFHDYHQVQQFSLSLDKEGAPNRDYHSTIRAWLRRFNQKFAKSFICKAPLFSQQISFSDFADGQASLLPSRTYEFANCLSGMHPYWGVKKYGPFRMPTKLPTFVFVFSESYRGEAQTLYRSLVGTEFPDKFNGMKEFFGIEFGRGNVIGKVISGPSIEEYERVAKEILSDGYANPVCIVLHSGEPSQYYFLKTIFLKYGIPCQVVEQDTIRRGRGFQWAVAGLGVQLFAKSGGYPWCVKTNRRDTLIIGLSQTTEMSEQGVERFIAYSVATDASGIFRSVRMLSDDQDEGNYAKGLGANLKRQLQRLICDGDGLPRRIVLHCSFRLTKLAMQEVRRVVVACRQENQKFPDIFVMRINTKHDYFGFDDSNAACVPLENSIVSVGRDRYLIWTEGVVPGRALTGRVSNPVLVIFDRNAGQNAAVEKELLEDLCCLAGANWRGFHARTRPVSVLYCELVGDFIRRLREYSIKEKCNLVLPDVEQFVPWFL